MLSLRYNALIAVFWLATMSWLVVAKVLPPLLKGEPPTWKSIVATAEKAGDEDQSVAWDILIDQRTIGNATSTLQPMQDGVKELRSEVEFWELPLESISPLRLGAFVRLPDGQPRTVSLSAKAAFEIDPLGRLLGFSSTLAMSLLPEPIHVQGNVEKTALKLTLRSGDFVYRTESFLPHDSLLTDALSPQSRLPGLRVGQTWLVPLYSPFHPRTHPLEALEAVVETEEPLAWHGRLVETLVVVYYSEQGGRLAGAKEARGRMWVRQDGAVLQQEAPLLNSVLRFVRRPDPVVPPATATPPSQPADAALPGGATPE
ncbi:MAG: hypothetical protein JNG90_14210 [Planctomycetaceae bacterium]|nr:hypothetical protein [Planctomycetaceae bacterium]